MAYKLEVDHPNYPKDFPLNLDGILVKNKGSVTVTEAMERKFVAKNRKPLKEIYGHSKIVKITGTSEVGKAGIEEILEGGE